MALDLLSTVEMMQRSVQRHLLQRMSGALTSVLANRLLTNVPNLVIGDICSLENGTDAEPMRAQVIGVDANGATLAPLGVTDGLSTLTRVVPHWRPLEVACGDGMLGGVFDGLGRPIDGRDVAVSCHRSITAQEVNPLERPLVKRANPTGIKAIDGLLTVGMGQRIGIFGGSGSGKTSLIGALARNFSCDVVVLGLIGERGREIREFLDRQLPPETRARCVIVTSTSDRPAMERVTGAHVASTIAEYFRDQGKHVLLILDSVTRFARALREVGLAAGEGAVRRGFTPSVYAELPRLVERSGMSATGAITAIYTVLAEDEQGDDPIVEEIQSLTDGHIHLSSRLGQSGHYPAIDILRSNSRLMNEIVSPDHASSAQRLRELMAKYTEVEMLLQVGEYRRGSDTLADEAIDKHPAIIQFLKQQLREASPPGQTLQALAQLAIAPRVNEAA